MLIIISALFKRSHFITSRYMYMLYMQTLKYVFKISFWKNGCCVFPTKSNQTMSMDLTQ